MSLGSDDVTPLPEVPTGYYRVSNSSAPQWPVMQRKHYFQVWFSGSWVLWCLSAGKFVSRTNGKTFLGRGCLESDGTALPPVKKSKFFIHQNDTSLGDDRVVSVFPTA